jgi:hypothetical protein
LPFTRRTAVPWTCGTSSSSVTCHPSVMIMLPTDRPRCAVEWKRLTHCLRIPPLSTHTGRRGRLGVLKPKTSEGTQGLPKTLPL